MTEQEALAFDPAAKPDAKGIFERLAERLLGDYVARLPKSRAPKAKEINDPVWQTVTISPLEVVILDSPMLQRLREIRQLGVAHFVYPGTTHTRLEHSLGVLHQMQRLVDAINTSAEKQVIDSSTTKLLRVIALCHDIGHGVMSHVSENALRQYNDVIDLELEFGDLIGKERSRISEIASYYMVGSPSFKKLLSEAASLVNDHGLPADAIEKIRAAIVGQKISDEIPLLNELISGPFDADKLDYMTRDALMAGVPVVTDIPRLVKKVRAVTVGKEDLPADVARAIKQLPAYTMTGIALSGGRTLDELMLGRTLLFDKIYRHQKVRAAEAMVASMIEVLALVTKASPVELPYLISDDELLHLDRLQIERMADRKLAAEDESNVSVVADLARRLRTRRFLVRAFAFAEAMPLDDASHNPAQHRGLEQLVRDAGKPEARTALLGAVLQEVHVIAKALGDTTALSSIPENQLGHYVVLDPPKSSSPGGDISRAFLISDAGKLIRFRDDSAEMRGWADAYLLTRDVGYIFAPEEFAPYVFLAAQRVVREKYGVQIPESMVAYAKQDGPKLDELRKRLQAVGYYAKLPHDLRPIPDRLGRADIPQRLNILVQRLQGYSGPLPPGERTAKIPFDAKRVIAWLRQFETDELIEQALSMLELVRLIGRSDVTDAVRAFIGANPEFNGAYVCPLGEPKDSAGIVAYFVSDVSKEFGLDSRSLSDALTDTKKPILFVDDFIGSGGQAVDILEHWLGEAPTGDLGESRRAKSDEGKAALRARKLGFLFLAGLAQGQKHLEKRAEELKLEVCVAIHLTELPYAFDQGHFPALKAKATTIGNALMRPPNVAEEKVGKADERALGYGGYALVLLFPYNTPTHSLTCLWAQGLVDGREWQPLFPRRKKT